MFLLSAGDNEGIKLMQKWRFGQYVKPLLVVGAIVVSLATAGTALAVSNSPNYQITETQIGGGSSLESCSEQYCAHVTIGDVGGANTNSSAEFGSINTDEPVIEVIIESGQSNLGVLTTETTATKTTIVKVRSVLSSGYTLQMVGDPPKFEGRMLSASTTPIESRPGTEQFGINVVANTTPNVGAMPKQTPENEGIYGEAEPGYDVPNLFKFENGGVIARGLTESGRTDYTISMVVNISSSTPAADYATDFTVVVVPTY